MDEDIDLGYVAYDAFRRALGGNGDSWIFVPENEQLAFEKVYQAVVQHDAQCKLQKQLHAEREAARTGIHTGSDVDMRLELAEKVCEEAARFCEEINEDSGECDLDRLLDLHEALDKYEALVEQAEAERDALAARVAEWEEWFGCSSPHDTEAAKATILGREQARANRLAARVALLEAELAEARKEIEALRIKPWQDQIDGQAETISRLRYELTEARKEIDILRTVLERVLEYEDDDIDKYTKSLILNGLAARAAEGGKG